MQTILDDIELDIKELKELIELTNSEPVLMGVAKRRIQRIQKRLSDLEKSLNKDIVVETEIAVPSTENIELSNAEVLVESTEDLLLIEEVVQVMSEGNSVAVQADLILGEHLKSAMDLSKAFSLNDSFRFSRELFDGDSALMNRVLKEVSELDSMDNVMSYLSSRLSLDEENDALVDFLEILKKYFD